MSEQVKSKPKSESIRQWYGRTTSGARKGLLIFSITALVFAALIFIYAPHSLHATVQQFNGAYTIPVAGLIWILGFLYIFLIPQREVGFRTQEFVESMSNSVKDTIEKEVVPAVKVWQRVGETIERELPIFLKNVQDGISEIREASKKLSIAVEKNEALVAEARPAIEALRRIEGKFEEEIKNGFFENARAALDSVRMLGGMPTKPTEEPAEDLSFALRSIRKNKVGRSSP